ncbi:uncharacterized protein LOC122638759 [Telopea speciosissima]|uniref:uncharacterized protein LOC122638759 n=1 Tax=Telopea speciosissima TaxID=54955 RepID=UPI001CC551EF|nr:uncharacterized protein LOC122638759 [Telopea speciosissima]
MFDIDGVVDQHIVLSVGQEFINVNQFREVLMEYEIQEGIQVLKKQNDKSRVTGICSGRGCPWRIHASPNNDGITFVIKTLNPNHICQRTKYIINEETDGSHARAYKKLQNYGLLVKEKNPGTEFQGFLKGCRPFIGLDDCHLKGVYSGVLVSAIAIDGNNGMVLLAYGVGLIEAFGIKFPVAHHRHCSRHLYNNFKTQFGGGPTLRGYFWRASKSYNATGFQRSMNTMKEEKLEAYEWLMKTLVYMWARHASDHKANSNRITNNMTESFNQWVGPFRGKLTLILVHQIRLKLMGRFQKRVRVAAKAIGCCLGWRVAVMDGEVTVKDAEAVKEGVAVKDGEVTKDEVAVI